MAVKNLAHENHFFGEETAFLKQKPSSKDTGADFGF